MIRARSSGKKNATALYASLAKSCGLYLRGAEPKPNVELLGIPLPPASDQIANQLARAVRAIVLALPRIENETKRASLGATLIAIADSLEALELPDTQPYYLKD